MNNNFNYYTGVIGYPILFVILIWLIFWVEFRFNVDLKSFGIQPRKLEGISGIIFSPFLHSSLEHLFNNSIPLFLLSSAIFFFYRTISWKIIFLGIFLSGLLTWIIGRDSTHIGASGLIYVLISFIFFKGIISKNFNLMALSLIVVFIYGGTIWYVFPIKNNMSWEGHLSGFMIGVLLALLFKKNTPVNKVYKWENEDYDNTNDPFLNQFDKDGNFIEKDEL
jgi:membrane associated rhomboid family serine protease|tara:strand:+ start:2444 stop:3109 length:666 start_codon:yes stop_codon:yes gene_type:complete